MADFLEERIDHQKIRMGAAFTDQYAVSVVRTSGGQEYRSLTHPFPVRTFDISQFIEKQEAYDYICALYHRAHGQYAGFRIRCYDEFSSNGSIGTPTGLDQPLLLVSAGVYQLVKQYGTSKAAGATGYPYRVIHKPVSGSVKVGIAGSECHSSQFTVNTTNGQVTMAANVTKGITNISKSAQAVIEFGVSHSYVAGQCVHISGVSGMTQINGLRGVITTTATTNITVNINSSGFSVYTSGGTVNTYPQTGETMSAGFEFDWPVRFNGSLVIGQDYPAHRNADGLELVELLNP
jgi:uncharacterized protein (TIGR02217 family)